MGATTGPILAAGAITALNRVVLTDTTKVGLPGSGPPGGDALLLRIAIATGIGAMGFSLWEAATPRTATAVSWLVLMTVLLIRVDPRVPAPLETLSNWYNTGSR